MVTGFRLASLDLRLKTEQSAMKLSTAYSLRSPACIMVCSLLFCFCIGCGGAGSILTPAKILKHGGDDASGACGALKPLRVRVESPLIRGVLGGTGGSHPIAGVTVEFEIVSGPAGALVEPARTATDAGGEATANVRLGAAPGDHFIRAFLPAYPDVRPAVFRVASGVEILGDWQEGHAGAALEKAIGVRLTDAAGAPVVGVPVSFRVVSGGKARLSRELEYTNDDGVAAVELVLGPKAGTHVVEVTAGGGAAASVYRPFLVKAVALEGWGALIGVLGGLAVFIVGLRMMSEGLQRVAGDRLRAVLGFFTRNRIAGVLTGLGVTALVQSSSATTVMLVGFVNAGLVNLRQAVGVVMGANIGTTVTAQIVSFKLVTLAYPAIAVGLVMEMLGRRKNVRFWGHVLIGFGLLFMGMQMMEHVLKTLADSPTVHRLFAAVDCTPGASGRMQLVPVVLGVLFGTLLTMTIQSSSASIGLLLALAGAGFINYWSAIPVLFGDNIGTTITAQLAALGANRAARRTAMVHTLFNLFGVVYMSGLFYVTWSGHPVYLELIDRLTSGDAFGGENIERHIANAHTLFNTINVLVLLPFSGLLALVVEKMIPPGREEAQDISYLEPHLLDTPALAIRQISTELVYMGRLGRKSLREAYEAAGTGNLTVADGIRRREEKIDQRQEAISNYVVQLSQRELGSAESRLLPHVLHANNDFERIGDHAENFMELAERKVERRLAFSDEAQKQLDGYFKAMDEMFGLVLSALERFDAEAIGRALKKEEYLNTQKRELERAHFERLESGTCQPLAGVVFLDYVANIEKVGDHLTNIAEAAMVLAIRGDEEAADGRRAEAEG